MRFNGGVCVLFLCLLSLTNAKCPTSLGYVIEHAVWRGWHQAIIYTTYLESDCHWAILHLIKCLGVNGIASAVNVKGKARLDTFLGIVIFHQPAEQNATNRFIATIKQITDSKMNTAYYDWLVMAKSLEDFKSLSEAFHATDMRFDQNVLVALPDVRLQKIEKLDFCNHNFNYKRNKFNGIHRSEKMNRKFETGACRYSKHKVCNETEYEISYYRSSERFRNLTRYRTYRAEDTTNVEIARPLWRSSFLSYNYSRSFRVLNADLPFKRIRKMLRYNISVHDNNVNIYVIQAFKMRLNSTVYVAFLGAWNPRESMRSVYAPYPVEARNLMGETFVVGKCNSSIEGFPRTKEDNSAPDLLDNVLDFLALRLNATYNIYIRHQETSAVRDIFLAPFSPKLLACVVCVAIVVSITLLIISKMTMHVESRRISCTDAAIWSMGILCQQGSCWRPSNPAAGVLLIVYLLFALVIYNSYAAFITSVLSVRVANVGSLGDVLQSPYIKIGYVRNGEDQMYLMSTKDVQLNAFYIRGYSEAENLVSSAEEGLIRAAMQDYAFFSGQRAARATIRSLSQARGRCALRELPVMSTRAQLAFPLSRGSPYARPVLVSLLQLRSGGILPRLEAALVPSMPQCKPSSGFASARAADVMTALFVILTGFIAAILIGVAEFTWSKRKELKRHLGRRIRHIS